MPRRRVNRYSIAALSPRVPPHYYDVTRTQMHPASMTTLASFTSWIAQFLTVIADPRLVSPNVYSALIQDGSLTSVDAYDMLYWLDAKLKTNRAGIGYTNRLSEATGWGDAAPTTLTGADPLGLVSTLEGLSLHVAIIDNDTADGGDAQNGPVIPTYGGGNAHPCTRLDGSTAMGHNGSGGLFTDTNETAYFYRLWKHFDSLHEQGGGSSVRFPKVSTAEVVVLVRYATNHQLARECVLRKISTDSDCARITITGYPGEFPLVRMGNSTSTTGDGTGGDTSPTSGQVGVRSGGTAKPAMINVGAGVNTGRTNVHFRNFDFQGNRSQIGGSSQIFAAQVMQWSATATSGSVRFCRFKGTQFIRDDDSIVGFDTLRDAVWGERPTENGVENSSGIQVLCDGFVFDSNYVQPVAKAAWPSGSGGSGGAIENYASYAAVWLDAKADNLRITRNTFTGVKSNSMMRLGDDSSPTDGCTIADNDFEVYDKVCIDVFRSANFVVERNRCHDFAHADYELENGGNGIKINYSSNGVVQDNVVFNHETAHSGATGIAVINSQGLAINTSNIIVRRNLVYRAGIALDRNTQGTITGCEVYDNIVAGMTEARKGAASTNAPFTVDLDRSIGTLEGNLIYDNQVWRFATGTPTQSTIEAGAHLAIKTTASQNTYSTTDTLAGWTGNVASKPAWAGDPEVGSDDFRLSSDVVGLLAEAPYTAALSQAWEPT